LAKSHSHHYPGLLEQKRPSNVSRAEAAFKKFINYSQTSLTLESNLLKVGKVLLLAKQT